MSGVDPEDLARLAAGRPVCLLGARGAGKSTVGRRLAELVGRAFADTDELTLAEARAAGLAAEDVATLLGTVGVARFRNLEAAALRSALGSGVAGVLATGGGTVERADARSWLGREGLCVWLREELEVLRERVRRDGRVRPPLTPGGDAVAELEELLGRREPWYAGLAHLVVDGAGRDPDDLAKEIASRCQISAPK